MSIAESSISKPEHFPTRSLITNKQHLSYTKKTLIFGILNVTPDSFSDGGHYFRKNKAVEHALRMEEEGAHVIDIGGESTRPGAPSVEEKEELRRVIPVIEAVAPRLRIPLSIDTYKAGVARAALEAGASIVNDISALRFDDGMEEVILRYQVPVIVMHMLGTPRTMQKRPRYKNVVSDIIQFLQRVKKRLTQKGFDSNQIILDPGIGFGKTVGHNFKILQQLNIFRSLGCPLLVGVSRKSFIGKTLNLSPHESFEGTAAAVAAAILYGADFVRVHDVKAMARVVRIIDQIKFS